MEQKTEKCQALNLKFIAERRKALKLTQADMAEKLGMCNHSLYCKYETGEYKLNAETIPALAEALQCSIQDFFNTESDAEKDVKENTAQTLERLSRQMDEVIKRLDRLNRIQVAAILYHENPKSELFQGIEESVLGAIPKSSENRHEDTGRKLEDYAQNIQMIRFPYGGQDRDTHEVVNADAFSKFRNQADFSNL